MEKHVTLTSHSRDALIGEIKDYILGMALELQINQAGTLNIAYGDKSAATIIRGSDRFIIAKTYEELVPLFTEALGI